ncbi:hypothetical protein B0H16DRAFT_1704474 [Mycena metata]|uniref:Uncharacterized protein n=1 Tax=Mycena metata TaxID=1033252 RepID=A0AAD7GV10_9AGAR|nr:hypothetical protein B0H16DRAFT_1704474 [Mycena metata]
MKVYDLLKARPMSTSEPGLAASDLGLSAMQATLSPKKSDYPLVQFWYRHEYNAFLDKNKGESTVEGPQRRGNSRASQGINVAMLYVCDEDGKIIDGFRATAIRALTHAFLGRLEEKGLAPVTWGKGGLDMHRNLSAAICAKFPEMGLCENDWKVQYMVTNMYSSWYTHRKGGGVKSEPVDDGMPTKRDRDESNTYKSTSKRPKTTKKAAAQEYINVEIEVSTDSPDVPMPSPVVIVNPLTAAMNPPPSETPDITSAPAPSTSPLVIVNPLTAALNSAPLPAQNTAAPTSIAAPVVTILQDSVPVPAITAPAPPAPRAQRKKAKATPGDTKTPRNLCMIDWCTKHPGGALDDFKVHWASIEGTTDEQIWTVKSTKAISAKTQAAK